MLRRKTGLIIAAIALAILSPAAAARPGPLGVRVSARATRLQSGAHHVFVAVKTRPRARCGSAGPGTRAHRPRRASERGRLSWRATAGPAIQGRVTYTVR